MLGPFVGPYRILDRLGAGGMGEVYLAEDARLRRRVAIKTVSEKRLGEPDAHRRLLREARAAANLNHPNIAAIHDIVEQEDRAHIVMEFVAGETLAKVLRAGPLPPARAIEIGLQVADALAAAHATGIVHRDLKPANIMITPEGRAKVLDFGLAKRCLAEDGDSAISEELTPDGQCLVGTPLYMSPEQILGEPLDERTDIWSLGVVLFEALTGRRPYAGRDIRSLAMAILYSPPPSPRSMNPSVPSDVDAVVSRAMAKEASARYGTAAEMRDDLARADANLDGITWTRSRIGLRLGGRRAKRLGLAAALLLTAASAIALLPGGWSLGRGVAAVPPEAVRWYEQGVTALREGAYLTASKRLERAIALHDAYPLAHARLAEARAELDDDRAKDELLYVQKLVPDLSRLPREDALYLEGVRGTVTRHFADAVRAYEELASLRPVDSAVQFDLGRAHEGGDRTAEAIACYERAARLDPQSPAPLLRLGDLRGRQQKVEAGLEAFAQAETLYDAASNLEGVTEVACLRGALFNELDRLKEGRAELERAARLAVQTGNTHQRIRALLGLSGVAASEGATTEAEALANQAVELARGMEGLTTSGLIDLGNVFFVKGQYDRADRVFQQALQAASRRGARRAEARAQLSLGSLRVTQGRPQDAMPFLDQALAFYGQGGFPRQASLASMLVGQTLDLRGDFEAAAKAFDGQLRFASQLNDDTLTAQAHLLLGLVLFRWERLPDALRHLKEGEAIYRRQGHSGLTYCLLNEAHVLLDLGQAEEARAMLGELRQIVQKGEGVSTDVRQRVELLRARVAVAEGRLQDGDRLLRDVLEAAATNDDVRLEAAVDLAFVRARQRVGASAAARDAVARARRLGDPSELAQALLAEGAALFSEMQGAAALAAALKAGEEAERRDLVVCAWQARALAAKAAALAGDAAAARAQGQAADERLARLQAAWGAASARPLLVSSSLVALRLPPSSRAVPSS